MFRRSDSPIRIAGFCYSLVSLSVGILVCTPLAAQQKGPGDFEWGAYNGTYEATRFSPLKQITPDNVQSLVQVGRYELPETTSFQAGPLVISGVMYVTTATSTYALDARTGALRWSHKYSPKTMALKRRSAVPPTIREDSIEAPRMRTFSHWTPTRAKSSGT